VPGRSPALEDLTDSVNAMCGNLTARVRNIANVTTAVARGDLSRKITVDVRRRNLELNGHITRCDQLNSFASEVTRVAREVGHRRQLGGSAGARVAGTWKGPDRQRQLPGVELTAQGGNIADVATAIAAAISQKITGNCVGEILKIEKTLNTMVDQLNAFRRRGDARGARSRHRGRLGGQAMCSACRTWKDLTGERNSMRAT